MKKFTLSLATLFVAVAAIASPTAEEVSALTLRIDKVDGATIRVKNSDDLNAVLNENGSISLNNFEGYSSLKVFFNEDGSIYAPAQTFTVFDEDTYETVYYLAVPAASKNKTPMEAYNDRITGTYVNGRITLDAWNAIKTTAYFSENLGTLYAYDVTTMVVAPNAQVASSYWVDQYDDETWDFIGWYATEIEESVKNAYVEQEGNNIYVYNFDDIYGTAKFTINPSKDNLTITADPSFVAFKRINSSGNQTDYTIKAIPEELTEEEVSPLDSDVTGSISDEYHFSFGDCGLFNASGSYTGSLIAVKTVTLDNPLDITPTGINTASVAKQVAGVKYVNMMGVESTTPFQGVNIVVTRYTDGTTSATKQLMK